MTIQVLVVDDRSDFAEQVCELLKARTGIGTAFACSPDSAIAAVESHAIAVVVLDQKMPLMAGTELFKRLRAIRSDIRAIMLTGEADADEVGAILKLGYKDYLPKGRISELPEIVATQFVSYLASRPSTLKQSTIVWPRNRLHRWWSRVEIRLVSNVELESRHVDDASWRTILQLTAGEERKIKYEVSRTQTLSFDEQSQRALKNTLRLGARSMAGAVTSIVEASTLSVSKTSASVSRTISESNERILKLPPEHEQQGDTCVIARHFQQAPVTSRRAVTLQVRCKCCSIETLVPVQIFENTGLVATRHEDYLQNEKKPRIVDTGFVYIGP